ncbi:MAG TPA: Ig-like domain-containing protein, partial [Dehalococcoidia bacterium]|nr:Ig-like domain-containing protein [Dehalococcoidia bacterium]
MNQRNAAVHAFGRVLGDVRVMGAVMLIAVLALFLALKTDNQSPSTGSSNEPRMFSVTPAGAGVDRLTPIEVTFAQAPSQRDASRIVQLEPATQGQYVWQSDRTLIFQPDYPGLLRGEDYKVVVAAQPDAGLPKGATTSFTTAGKLDVTSVIPAPDDVEVPDNVQVLVQFSRSVAPLTLLSEQPKDSAVTFDPPLAGRGEWLNTALYRFVPDPGALQPNTKYTATVPAGLSSAADGVLAQPYVWSFTTFSPALTRITPDRNTQYVGPQQQVVLEFNQAMDRASVEAGFQLLASGSSKMPGSFAWSQGDTVATFAPSSPLAGTTSYDAVVPAGLKGANGGVTQTEQRAGFSTVGAPKVVSTNPPDGSTAAQRYGISVVFNNPMDVDSFDGKVSVSGIDPDALSIFPQPDGPNLYINTALQPSTAYTVTLAGGITDRYGQPLPPFSFSFTTGQRPPSLSFAVPGQIGTYSAATEPILYFHTTNMDQASFTLYPLTRDELRTIQQRNYISQGPPGSFTPSQTPIATWTEDIGGPRNDVLIESTSLSRKGGPLPAGDYFVRSGSGTSASEFAFSVVDTGIVTKLSYNELLVWAIDLTTGQPVPNLSLSATGPGITGGPATTGADGIASFPLPSIFDR